jgi:type VI secretion system secreted protein VgrG
MAQETISPRRFSQAARPMKITTPLGKDVLLLTKCQGAEGISELFQFSLEMIATNDTAVPFDKILGQKATVELELPGNKKRFISGIISKLSQGKRDDTFTSYRAELVPQLWLLSRRLQCRIFQHLAVPDILKKVLEGIDVAFELEGTFDTREYCVQYNESDFAFASRLMEEEGICYYFRHADGGHTLVLTNSNAKFKDVPEYKTAIFGDIQAKPDELRVTSWEKTQELRSGKVTLWDHSFELPDKHLEVEKVIQESVAVGKETHKLKLANNDKLEIYDYPGDYATWFDGVDKGGGDQAARLKKIFDHNKRIVEIRMQEEAAASVVIEGKSTCRQFIPGHKFTLERHFNADGSYLLTHLEHKAVLTGNYRSGEGAEWTYENEFRCIPLAVQYRPPRNTPYPIIEGTQTAVVVGPPGETIYPDKYGRVKVQFFWDRHGKKDANSSCWVRVSNNWGGAEWGGMFLPHVGQEVIVSFENGDPDRPIVTGRVYNAETMPPLKLPDNKTKSIIRDHGGNQIVMEGKGGDQRIAMYSPHSNTTFRIGSHNSPDDGIAASTDAFFTALVGKDWKEQIDGDKNKRVKGSAETMVSGNNTTFVGQDNIQEVRGRNEAQTFGINVTIVHNNNKTLIDGSNYTRVFGVDKFLNVGAKHEIILAVTTKLHVGAKLEIDAAKDLVKTPLAQKVAGVMDHAVGTAKDKIGSLVQKLGSVARTMAKLVETCEGSADITISGPYTMKGNPIKMESGGDMNIKAPTTIFDGDATVKGQLVVYGDGISLQGVFSAKK